MKIAKSHSQTDSRFEMILLRIRLLLLPILFGIFHYSQGQINEKQYHFLGSLVTVRAEEGVFTLMPDSFSKGTAAQYHADFSELAQSELIKSLTEWKRRLKLDDVLFCRLIQQTAKNFRPEWDERRQVFFTWAVLSACKLRVSIVVFRDQSRSADDCSNLVGIWAYTRTPMYPWYTEWKKESLFLLTGTCGSRLGYDYQSEVSFNQADTLLKVDAFTRLSDWPSTPVSHTVTFINSLTGLQDSFSLQLNQQVIEIMREYPAMQLKTYFRIPVSEEVKSALRTELGRRMKGLSLEDSLKFLQTFAGTTALGLVDQVVFGKEKFMCFEEALFYKTSDCDDNSVRMANLLKLFFSRPFIVYHVFPPINTQTGAMESTHVAPAILLPRVCEKGITFKGKRFCHIDPSCLNCEIGVPYMPMSGYEVKIIYDWGL